MKKSSVKWALVAVLLAFGLLLSACSNTTETTEVTRSSTIEDLPTISDLKVQAGDGTQDMNKPVLVVSWKAENIGNYPVTYVMWVKGKEGTKKVIQVEAGSTGEELRNAANLRTIDIDKREYLIWDDNSKAPVIQQYDGLPLPGGNPMLTILSPKITPARADAGGSYYTLRNKHRAGNALPASNTATYIPLVVLNNGVLPARNAVVLDSGIDLSGPNPVRADGANFDPPQNWAELSWNSSILSNNSGNPSSVLRPDAAPGTRIIFPDQDNKADDRWYARIDLAAFIQALTQISDMDTTHSVNPMESDYFVSGTLVWDTRTYQDVDFEYQIGVQAVVNYRDGNVLDCDDPRFFIDPATAVYAPQTVRVFSLYNITDYDVTSTVLVENRAGNSTIHNEKVSGYIANPQKNEKVYQLGLLQLNAQSIAANNNNPNPGLQGLGVLIR